MSMVLRTLKKSIECLIFISEKPLSVDSLNKHFPDNKKSDIRQCLEELIHEWRGMDRGFSLSEVSGGYQFRTSPEFADLIQRFRQSKPFKLSRAALEILAIIAYKHPITRLDIDQIRGVDSSGVLSVLLERELIDIRGRKDVPGRPFLYGITDKFLETFSLKSLDDLPTLKELEAIEEVLSAQVSLE